MAIFKNSPPIINDGLVLFLDAANIKSYPITGTTWNDLSGLNNGTLTNGATFSSDNSGSIVFDGTDDYVNIGVGKSCNGFSGDFCVSSWVNRSNVGDTWGNIIGDYRPPETPLMWQLAINKDGSIFFYSAANGFVFGFPVLSGFGPNNWINVAISRIGSVFKLYVNAKLLATRTNTSTFGSPTENLNIGVDGDNTSERFKGKISTVMIYKNRGLTDSEILQNYNATKQRYNLT
jgi:hypothetical protein